MKKYVILSWYDTKLDKLKNVEIFHIFIADFHASQGVSIKS